MPAYITNGTDTSPKKAKSDLTPEDYKALGEEQFLEFSRLFLKDSILQDKQSKRWIKDLDREDLEGINRFFERIPNYMIDFSSEISRKLLLKYIMSNLRYGFDIDIKENDWEIGYGYINRLYKLDPRMIKH